MNEYERDPDLETPGDPGAAAHLEPPVPAPPAREPVGVLLKTAREAAGLTVRDVADSLNIRFLYLQALEDSEYGGLPGTAYALGFLRTYAQHLGLDTEELIHRYKEEQAGLDKKPDLVFPTPVPESKVPGAALILASVLLMGLAYGAWTFFSGDETAIAELVPAVPQRLQNLMGEEESEAPAVPQDEQTVPATQSGGVASLPNTSSPIFVLPQPDEESGVMPNEPAESLAAMPAPASRETTPEAGATTVAEVPQAESGPAAEPVETLAEALPAGSEPAEAPQVETSQAEAPEEAAAEPPAATAAGGPAVTPAEPVTEAAPAESPESQIEAAAPLAAPEPELATTPTVPEVIEAPEPAVQTAAVPEAPAAETIPSAPATEAPAPGLEEHSPKVYGAANTNPRIILRAIQDSWVQVRDSEDSLLLTRLLRAGDSYRVPNRIDLTMLTGNAGGLRIEIDGNSVGTLGPVGKVRRDVALDPTRLLQDPNLIR